MIFWLYNILDIKRIRFIISPGTYHFFSQNNYEGIQKKHANSKLFPGVTIFVFAFICIRTQFRNPSNEIIVHLLSRVQACQDPRKEIVLMSPLLPLMIIMISFNAATDTAGRRISQKGPCWSIMLIWRIRGGCYRSMMTFVFDAPCQRKRATDAKTVWWKGGGRQAGAQSHVSLVGLTTIC